MKKVSLSGSPRENVGKKDAKKLRSTGMVPCVLYGGSEQVHFHAKELDLTKIVKSPDVYQVDIDVNGKGYSSLIREVQMHPVTERLVHVDFLETVESKPVVVELPLRLTGTSVGVRAGGKLNVSYRKIAVRGVAANLPDAVEVDISELAIGDGIKVRDLDFPGLKFMAPDAAQLVSVKRARVVVEEVAEDEEGEEGTEEGGTEGAAASADGGDAPKEGGDAPKEGGE